MKRIFSFVTVLAISLLAMTSCNWFDNPVVIPGNPGSQVINLATFDKIDLYAPVHLHLTQDGTQKVEVVADSLWMARIDAQVVNGTLEVRFLPDSNSTHMDTLPQYDVDVLVSIPDLERVRTFSAAKIESTNRFNIDAIDFDLDGASDVSFQADADDMDIHVEGASNLDLDIDVNELRTEIEGAGKIEAIGTADSHDLDIDGVGNVEAFDLIVDDYVVDLAGAGDVAITAQNTLDVSISGIGKVSYKGNPTITQNISGLGTLEDAN